MSTPRTRILCVTLIVRNSYCVVNTSWYRRLRLIIDSWLVINNVSKYPINMLCYNVLCFGVAIIIIVFHAYIHIRICQVGLNPSVWTFLSSLGLYWHQIMSNNVRTFNIPTHSQHIHVCLVYITQHNVYHITSTGTAIIIIVALSILVPP
jgi:hypothetical protein